MHAVQPWQVVNFDFFSQPGSACTLPNPTLFQKFDVITLGLFGTLFYIVSANMLVFAWMRYYRGKPLHEQRKYGRASVSQLVALLTAAYAPATETILSIFSCREINGRFFLREDVSTPCDDEVYAVYYRYGVFWTLVFPLGTPLFYLALMSAYGVPRVARELKKDAYFQQLCTAASRQGLHQVAGLDVVHVSVKTVSDAHVDQLYLAFFPRPRSAAEEGDDAGIAGEGSAGHHAGSNGQRAEHTAHKEPEQTRAASGAAADLSRKQKLRALVDLAHASLMSPAVTWEHAKKGGRLRGAMQSCGMLFKEFHADRWYW